SQGAGRHCVEHGECVDNEAQLLVGEQGEEHHVAEGWPEQHGHMTHEVHAHRHQHQRGAQRSRQHRVEVPQERQRYAPLRAFVENCVEPHDFSLGPQPAPPEVRVNK
ncbi:hypothetical protein EGW08_009693, partial [Elysia chlorotica]